MSSPVARLLFFAAVLALGEMKARRQGISFFRPSTIPAGLARTVTVSLVAVWILLVLLTLGEFLPDRLVPVNKLIMAVAVTGGIYFGHRLVHELRQLSGDRLSTGQRHFFTAFWWFWVTGFSVAAVAAWLEFVATLLESLS